ncbi:hypothetical protein [Algibacter sp. PT7-4]|uniref:hypothetical protein n=1 Tax=Algibacter ulvanivorans TaxID=3400999 RepID=UPI003AAA4A71
MQQLQELKNIERLALNTPNLKDYGAKGLDVLGMQPKKGFARLKNNKVVKLSEIKGYATLKKQTVNQNIDAAEIEAQAEKFPELFNCKTIGRDKNGDIKKGFYELKSGKVISLNKLKEAVSKSVKNIETTTNS